MPVLEFAEQALDAVAPAVLHSIVRRGVATVALGGNNGLDLGVRQCLPDGIGIAAIVGQQRIDPVRDHAHQRAEALNVMRPIWASERKREGALEHRTGMELGGEPTARPAEALILLNP